MKYFIISSILLSIPIFFVQAQQLDKGYIVTIEGDTIVGFIKNGTDPELGFRISFQKEINSAATIYLASDLQGFGFENGKIFKRIFIYNNQEESNNTSAVFGKKIVEGKITLYSFRRPIEGYPDIILTNNMTHRTMHLTAPKKKLVVDEKGARYINAPKTYIGQIRMIKSDSLRNYESSSTIRYNIKSIKRDIIEYNNLFQDEYPVSQYIPEHDYFHEVTIGYPLKNSVDEVSFRIAFYRNKFFELGT